MRKEHAERGDPLPPVVKAGPDNPLGAYAMRLGITPGAYLIHGTNNPIAVGMAITHGCIRMYPEDIEALFPLVPVNTPVWLVNEPVKVARVSGQVWLEVHPPVDAEGQRAEVDLEGFYALANAALGETPAAIHWDFVLATLKEASGLPQMVGLELDAGRAAARTAAAAGNCRPAPAERRARASPAAVAAQTARHADLLVSSQAGSQGPRDLGAHFGDARGVGARKSWPRRRGHLRSALASLRSDVRRIDAGARPCPRARRA